jgi:HK97 family phage prohead protease
MPYGISDKQSDCTGWATVKINADGSAETVACHDTKQDAIDQAVAISIAEDSEMVGEVRQVRLAPPQFMREAARKGLRLHEEGYSGDGLQPQTVEDARKMASGSVSEAKWRKIGPWIARHMIDLDAVEGDTITAGYVAHLLWGSDGTKSGARRTMEYAENIVEQLDEERQMIYIEEPSDMVEGEGEPEMEAEDEHGDSLHVEVEAHVCIPKSWVITERNNRSVAYTTLEMRAKPEGSTLVGYAAIFDSPSEPLPWTEFVRRGAFRKTIKDGADVRLLIDHEGVPLARTRSGTLTLEEDDYGLRIEAQLDEDNPDARKIMSALRRGDISQMSFAFETVKDSWSTDKRTRELREVKLFDVSVVTYPAYEETVAELRSRTSTQADTVLPTTARNLRKRQIELLQLRAGH